MKRLHAYMKLIYMALFCTMMVGCGKSSPDVDKASSDKTSSADEKRRNGSLDSIVVLNIAPPISTQNTSSSQRELPKLTLKTETDSESSASFRSRTITRRGDRDILVDSLTADLGKGARRQQQIVQKGKVVCTTQRGDAKPTIHISDKSVQVLQIDCNADGRSDFLFLTDTTGQTLEGLTVGKDGLYTPVPSEFLFDESDRMESGVDVVKRYELRLHDAVEGRDLAGMKRLLDQGISANAQGARGNTPLHTAASRGFLRVVVALLDAGATRNATNLEGQTPLDLAVKGTHVKVSNYLKLSGRKGVYFADMPLQHASVGWGSFITYHSKSSGVSIGGRHYKTGFFAHANSSIKFVLDGKYDRFTSAIGLKTGAGGGATFQVIVDGKLKFRSRDMWSKGNSVGYGHVGLSVDVSGGQLLELKTYGVRGCSGSHSCWGDPKLHLAERPFLSNRIAFPAVEDDLMGILSLSPTKLLSVGSKECYFWDLSKPVSTIEKQYAIGVGRKKSAAWLGKSKAIAVAKGDTVELTTVKPNGESSTETWTLSSKVSCIYSPRCRDYLVVGTTEKKLYLWNPADKKVIWKRSGLPGRPLSIAYCPLKDELAIGMSGGKCIILRANTGDILHDLPGHMFSVTHLSYSPSGETLISSANDLSSIVWNTQDYSRRGQFIGHAGLVRGLDFLSEDLAISVDNESDVCVWNTLTMKVAWKLRALDSPTDLVVDRQSHRFYLCSKKGILSYNYDKRALSNGKP
jgi:hypothetical protein